MATLFLLCGLPGSGKTTLARQIEAEHNALRLTPDDWMEAIVGDGYDEARRAAVEAVQWEIAVRVLTLGANVILDFGFWSRAERDDLRARATALGAHVDLRFLDVPREELLGRLALRNANLPPATFRVTESDLAEWWNQFEPPTPDELA